MARRKQLTDAQCAAAKPRDSIYELDADGMGLVLRVTPSGVKSWSIRYRTRAGKRERYTLKGHYPDVSLSKARDEASAIRDRVRQGLAPEVPPEPPTGLADLFADWMNAANEARSDVERTDAEKALRKKLRSKTRVTYRIALTKFLAWASANDITETAAITRPALTAFCAHLVVLPRHSATSGKGQRGHKAPTSASRSPLSINRELRTMRTILNSLRRAGKLPQLDSDAISDCLEMMAVEHDDPVPFKTSGQIEKLLRACMRHDAATFKATRDEHAGNREGITPRYLPIAPFAAFLLLSGCRRGEALHLRWRDVDLDAVNDAGEPAGEFVVRADKAKTRRTRTVYLEVSPALRQMLIAMKRGAGHDEHVFERYTAEIVSKARERLVREFGAPEFLWSTRNSREGERSAPTLRSTCAAFLTNAPGIFGQRASHASAAQLGHSIKVAEDHYLGVIRGIPREARTLEAAMRIEDVLREVLEASGDSADVVPIRGRR